jgi:CrcB protein
MFTTAPSRNLPYATLFINVTGSFVLGLFLTWSTARVSVDPRWRLLIAVGFCGGYTTYSTYAYETFMLLQRSQWVVLVAYVFLTNTLCVAGVALGSLLARAK